MLTVFRIVAFVVASAGPIHASRVPLRNYRVHGFYRFFAWEAALALFLLNLDYRLYQPFSVHHSIAMVFFVISLLLAFHGFQLLRKMGKLDRQRNDPTLFLVEKTTVLVTAGTYKFIRHPLYCSFIFLTWSTFLVVPSWLGGSLAMLATLCLIVAAKVEERENIDFFGDAYRDYMKRTKMFIPFVI